MEYTHWLSNAALAAEVIALPFLAWQILLGRKENRRSRDLEISMTLSQSFREHWESTWEDALLELEEKTAGKPLEYRGRREMSDNERELLRMLNWIDWVGTALRTKMLTNTDVLLKSIGPTIRSILALGRPIVEAEVKAHGCDYWGSLLHVGRRLDMDWARQLIIQRKC